MGARAAVPARSGARVVVLAVVAVLAVAAGVVAAIFGPAYAAIMGALISLVGAIAVARGARWAHVLLVVGLGLLAGSAIYVLLGLVAADGAASAARGTP